eukprot:303038-Amphidinium_carterae.1
MSILGMSHQMNATCYDAMDGRNLGKWQRRVLPIADRALHREQKMQMPGLRYDAQFIAEHSRDSDLGEAGEFFLSHFAPRKHTHPWQKTATSYHAFKKQCYIT